MLMYRILLLMLLSFVFSSDTVISRPVEKAGKQQYKLVFSDEFNLPDGSQPDSTKWGRAEPNSSMWARWISESKDVVYIDNGSLVCRAIPNPNKLDTAAMITGAINSKDKFSFQYGKVEVRIKTNRTEGNFPAAWMRPQDVHSKIYGEIDIFEVFGADAIAHQTVHSQRTVGLKRKDIQNAFTTRVKVNRWHVYSVEWTPTFITFYVDGKLTGTYAKASDKKVLSEGQWTFDRPFFLILNQSVGMGNWHTPDTSEVYETYFDWIRVYQLL